ncbi:MAG: B12-binding domain-containing radical SAM protein [Nanoarchaeota archaeon]|nr:B12-binding domain-containing radical SAM protein [Nanoarchaeota archaeon]MBU1052011.1 B12-binding domain-containing radical SAM protein [Nanoarchaeota archaeon]MBU1988000.1 B12-binding domain-containing radical SAM protein [Nanoarchaeota archaeon]
MILDTKQELKREELRVILVSLQSDAERVPPVGLVYVATYLQNKLKLPKKNIRVVDRNYFDVEKEVEKFNPDVIGIGAMTINYPDAVDFASKIKKRKDIPIILGGVHISTLPASLKKCFDVGVIGEGEETISELLSLYLKKRKFIKKDLKKIKSIVYFEGNEIRSTLLREPMKLDSLPLPDFKFAHPNYFKKIEVPGVGGTRINCYLISSRGCPYRCVFCSTSRFWGKMRLHSPEYTARIIEKNVKEFGANHIKILDDLFTISAERVNLIKRELEKRNLLDKIKEMEGTVRANLINDKLCREIKNIKLNLVNFGFESGSDKVLKYLKAGTVSVEMNKKAILLCKKYGIGVYGSLMYGSPGESIEDMEKTNRFIDFCVKNKVDNLWSFVATPFPATPFWEIALKKGKVSEDMNFKLLDHHYSGRPFLLDEKISTQEFRDVFFRGRKKLRKFKISLIKNFLIKNPSNAIKLFLKEPRYYGSRVFKQILKQ